MTMTAHDPATAAARADGLAVQVQDLRMRYGTHEVLGGLSFDIPHGAVVALLGPNGAGKSTTIEILLGFRQRSGGQVQVLGTDPQQGDEAWRARLGVVLQSWRDHARWTVTEVLEYAASHFVGYGTADKQRPRPVQELIDLVGLGAAQHQELRSLSGGQRRRVDVALGIVGNPDLLFLDEPTVGFDPEARRDFHTLITDLARSERTTVLLTTHDLHEAEAVADHILILNDGKLLAAGSPTALREQVGATTVTWTEGGRRRSETVTDAMARVRELTADPSRDVSDVGITRVSLEDAYLALIGGGPAGATHDMEDN